MNNLIYQSLKVIYSKLSDDTILDPMDLPIVQVFDDLYYSLYFDMSGFSLQLVEESLVEFHNELKFWRKIEKKEILNGVWGISIAEDKRIVHLKILKKEFHNIICKNINLPL
jgi:hypothetical protein